MEQQEDGSSPVCAVLVLTTATVKIPRAVNPEVLNLSQVNP